MPDDIKDGEREWEREVYVVIHSEETEITFHQTAASALLLQADISERNRSTQYMEWPMHTLLYYSNKCTTFKDIKIFFKACMKTFFRLKPDTLIETAFWSAFKFDQRNCFVISVLTIAPIQALNI